MAILAAVLVPTVTNKIKDANQSSAETSASAIANTIQSEIVAVLSGVKDTNNKYVAGTNGVVSGLKVGITSGTAFPEGNANVTITYIEGTSFTVKATVSGQDSSVYTIAVADGTITK